MGHMYFSSSTLSIITSIVYTILDQDGNRKREYIGDQKVKHETGVLLDLTFTVCDESLPWDEREETKSIRHYYLAFCGNTNVFMANRFNGGPGCGLKQIHHLKTDDWINLGNHDSCWSDSVQDFLRTVKKEMCDEVNPEKAMVQLETDCQIGFLGTLFKLVEMTTGPDPDRDNYWRKLVEIRGKA